MIMARLLVASLAALLIVSPALALEAAATNCSSLLTYGDCSPHLHCEWCGATNESYPISACYERGVGLTCCDEKNTPDFYCNSNVQICSPTETCHHQTINTGMGDCVMPVCCGGALPEPCYPGCMASGGTCCGEATACTSAQSCCGSAETGLACCDKDAACCESPDGYAHWCCPTEQQCNMNGGCDAL